MLASGERQRKRWVRLGQKGKSDDGGGGYAGFDSVGQMTVSLKVSHCHCSRAK